MTERTVFDLLAAPGPFPDDREKLMLYGRLVGSWSIAAAWYDEQGGRREMKGEWHFAWVLGGRAIQDVLFGVGMPPDRYGTTLRCYDSEADVWHIVWSQPSSKEFAYLLGRASGDDIVQEGVDSATGRGMRWSFSDITERSFLWTGEVSGDGGLTWFLEQEMRGTKF